MLTEKENKEKQWEQTKEELKKMKETYNSYLKELALFASNGDLSENADWSLVNERKELLFNEIIKKEIRLTNAKNNLNKKQEVVFINLKTGEEKTVWLNNEEISPAEGKISYDSSLGSALSKGEEGKISRIICEKNSYEVKIISKKWLT